MKKRKKQRYPNPILFQTEPDIIKNPKILGSEDVFRFECTLCGECCRNVEQSVLVETLDLYRIANYLAQTGSDITGMDGVIHEYTEMKMLGDVELPIFLLKTHGQRKECVFLKEGRCTIHEAKPRACRCYPLNPWPKDTMTRTNHLDADCFRYAVVSAKQHHFQGSVISVRDWMDAACDQTDRAFIAEDVRATLEIAHISRRLRWSNVALQQVLQPYLMYKYILFALDAPFMPQFTRNMTALKRALLELEHVKNANR